MSTNHEGPEMSNGPYTGMSVEDLEGHLANVRASLDSYRRSRDRIKAELKIARAREAADGTIPENPGWGTFGFNFRLAGVELTDEDGKVLPAVGHQYGGKISVVAGRDYYWFFESWEDMILWLRDTEKVGAVSRIWKMAGDSGIKSVTVR